MGRLSILLNRFKQKLVKNKETPRRIEDPNGEIMDFTNNVTHDLKKPLTTLKTLCAVLEKIGLERKDPPLLEISRMGKESVRYMEELLDDLLLNSRLEFSGTVPAMEMIDAEELIRQCMERSKYQIEAKKIQVKVDAPFKVRADRKSLMKIFTNLIGNAVNYIGDKNEPRIIIRCIRKEGEFELSVSDTGMGIPEKDWARVFQKFARGGNTAGIDGTGLGLPIVKAAVEAHGGRVWLKSEVGEGTTLYFTLPADTAAVKG